MRGKTNKLVIILSAGLILSSGIMATGTASTAYAAETNSKESEIADLRTEISELENKIKIVNSGKDKLLEEGEVLRKKRDDYLKSNGGVEDDEYRRLDKEFQPIVNKVVDREREILKLNKEIEEAKAKIAELEKMPTPPAPPVVPTPPTPSEPDKDTQNDEVIDEESTEEAKNEKEMALKKAKEEALAELQKAGINSNLLLKKIKSAGTIEGVEALKKDLLDAKENANSKPDGDMKPDAEDRADEESDTRQEEETTPQEDRSEEDSMSDDDISQQEIEDFIKLLSDRTKSIEELLKNEDSDMMPDASDKDNENRDSEEVLPPHIDKDNHSKRENPTSKDMDMDKKDDNLSDEVDGLIREMDSITRQIQDLISDKESEDSNDKEDKKDNSKELEKKNKDKDSSSKDRNLKDKTSGQGQMDKQSKMKDKAHNKSQMMKSTNPKTGIASITPIASIGAIAVAAIVASRKKEDK